jgi:hypothetical protein
MLQAFQQEPDEERHVDAPEKKRITQHLLDALPKNFVCEMLQRGRMHQIACALQEEGGCHRQVKDVLGAIAQRDPGDERQRNTKQQKECGYNASW